MKSDIVLTSMKAKLINVLEDEPKGLDIITSLTGLKYEQCAYVIHSLMREQIIIRKERGLYSLTKLGLDYQNLIRYLNLQDKNNFKLKGQIDKSSFLNSTEGAIITAAILSDGCLLHNRIKFLTTDASLNKFVWDTLEKIFNKKVNRNKGFLDGRINAEFLKIFSPTYHTEPDEKGEYPKAKIPDFIMNGTKEQKHRFLQTYLSCDGGMSFQIWWVERDEIFYLRSWVEVACKHPGLIGDLMHLLRSLNFNPHKISSGVALWESDIIEYGRIGFVNGCNAVHGKYWKGVEKNKLLELGCLISSFGSHIIPYKLRKQPNKEKVIEYMRFLLNQISLKGYQEVYDSVKKTQDEFLSIKSASQNWKTVLTTLKNNSMKYDSVASSVYPNDLERSGKHKVSIVLSRLKNKGLISNKNEKWYLTKKGLEYLEILSSHKLSQTT